MRKMNFKPGDIIENRWAGDKNPTKFFMFLSWKNRGIIGLEYHKGFKKCYYGRSSVEEPMNDGKPAFIKVGRDESYENLKESLKKWNEEK